MSTRADVMSQNARESADGAAGARPDSAADAVRRWAESVATARTPEACEAFLDSFPAEEAVALWRRHGKAAVPTALVDALVESSAAASAFSRGDRIATLLLPSLVDTRVGAYSYETYLALPVVLGDLVAPGASPRAVYAASLDRVIHLLVDLLALELRTLALDGDRPGIHVPHPKELWRRIGALAVAVAEFGRCCGTAPPKGLEVGTARSMSDRIPAPVAARLSQRCEHWLARRPSEDRQRVRLSLLPMSRSHDEQMFIRILQAFEALFTPLVALLESVASALEIGAAGRAAEDARLLAPTLRQGGHLFRVLSTMSADRFLSFRELTVGASALQSRQYKRIELLCSHPDEERAQSEAFACVPKEEWPARPLDAAVAALPAFPERDELVGSLTAFDAEFGRWKRAHCSIARRMIADRPGTGGTSGVAYLRANVHAPLFPLLAGANAARDGARRSSGPSGRAPALCARDYLAAVESRLLATVAAYPGTAANAARDVIEAGGRRLRPLLVFFASEPNSPPPVAYGAAVELLHIATLVHDDLLDRAPSRRGVPSTWSRYGDQAALATGIYLAGRALREADSLGDDDATAFFIDTCRALIQGEALQHLDHRNPALPLHAYVRRCQVKTGSLFRLACWLGGGAAREQLARFGLNLGVAFQMLDDIWDCELDAHSGKEPGTDLRSGTPTLPLLLAARADPRVADAIQACRCDDAVLERIRATGALEESRRYAGRFVERALQCLTSNGRRDELVWLSSALLGGLASESSLESILRAAETAIAGMAGATR